ncbi:Lectin-related protein [Triticum urartu]|uniref:Lectin-related protein n=1 Tax=Triticum urartu TaxID=4572 RepID=M7ZVR5_TRIUA|nr:Lectin-related protein [Triticum urartu]
MAVRKLVCGAPVTDDERARMRDGSRYIWSSFDFSNASSYRIEDLKLEGNAAVHDNLVDVTCNSFGESPTHCTGRVSYAHPVPFYDSATGEVASFQTRFTFAIMLELENNSKTVKGDGMAFFLAYYPSAMPPHSGGGNLGLLPSGDDGKSLTAFGNDRFVAVEFDTFSNSWDPDNTVDHIGIDISSMSSVKTTNLTSFSLNGSMTATITFDNTTRMLVADLQFHGNNTSRPVQASRTNARDTRKEDDELFLVYELVPNGNLHYHLCERKSREQVWELYIKGKVVEAADGRLHGGDDLDKRQMQRVAILGLWPSSPQSF